MEQMRAGILQGGERLSGICDLLKREVPGLHAVYLFGSAGTPFEREESDLDLGILPPAPLSVKNVWEISGRLAAKLGCDVDLIDLLRASVVMRFGVTEKGRRIYSDGSYAVREFESRVFSDYVRWNERRAPLLEAIRKRGRVYAR